MSNQHEPESECEQCGKKLKDPGDDPIYVVALNKLFCRDSDCWDIWRKENEY
jgi:hypothetical protein